MSVHTTNIQAFVEAATASRDSLVKSYCGLIAVELILKDAVSLKNHDVPAALNKFAHTYAIGQKMGCKLRLNTLSVKLKNDLKNIISQDTSFVACSIPTDCYPYIRYTRLKRDGWAKPSTTDEQTSALANTVVEIQSYLREKFQKNL